MANKHFEGFNSIPDTRKQSKTQRKTDKCVRSNTTQNNYKNNLEKITPLICILRCRKVSGKFNPKKHKLLEF